MVLPALAETEKRPEKVNGITRESKNSDTNKDSGSY
jgi:hypothetical protein